MREELIINGQHCDLNFETGITLEYVSNLLNEPGKISLSHSYTVKLPRTANNARILDLPERPAHDSSMARRYLPVHYYRNGINLIGDNAHAYITSATDEQYELVLVWDDIPELRALSESEKTINDLPSLPRLWWVGNSYGVESAGAVFARYTSSNVADDSENVTSHIHPCMRMTNLLQRIMGNAGVTYKLSSGALDDIVVLAAPDHKPDDQMLIDAAASVKSGDSALSFNPIATNMATMDGIPDIKAPQGNISYGRFNAAILISNASSCRVKVHFKLNTTVNYAGLVLRLVGATQAFMNQRVILAEIPLVREPAGYACIGQVDVAIPKGYTGFTPMLYISSGSLKKTNIYPYGNTGSLFEIITPFDSINVSIINTFPLGGNLPDIKQWDFIRNCMIIGGLTPIVSQTKVQFYKISEILDVTRAVNWTNKLYAANAVKVKPSLGNNWAQRNQFKFKEDEDSTRKPDFSIDIADETLKTDRDWAELDFAASLNNTAIHYISTDNGATYEDVDIEPRFFKYNAATESLNFTQDLYGEGLKAKYASLQAAIEKPVVLEATVRLTEIDLATLDLTRPVYLAQFGRYYHVLKVQTGKTDECKVELLQIA